jgi:hypothetical protein
LELGACQRVESPLAPRAGHRGRATHRVECDIQLRHWSHRPVLAQVAPLPQRLRDETAPERQKDGFIGWIARSYTRIELSDELNLAIQRATIDKLISAVVRKHGELLQGVYLRIAMDSETSATEAKPRADDMCEMGIVFVTHTADGADQVRPSLVTLMDAEVANPARADDPQSSKLAARRSVAKHYGIRLDAICRPATEWTAHEIATSIRHSLKDHLSGSDAAA